LAWGLVDALMYLVRVLADRGSRLALVLAVKNSPNAAVGIGAIRGALPAAISILVPDAELERVRARMAGAETLPGPRLHRNDVSNAARTFFLVVLSTFPVALPFALLDDCRWRSHRSNPDACHAVWRRLRAWALCGLWRLESRLWHDGAGRLPDDGHCRTGRMTRTVSRRRRN